MLEPKDLTMPKFKATKLIEEHLIQESVAIQSNSSSKGPTDAPSKLVSMQKIIRHFEKRIEKKAAPSDDTDMIVFKVSDEGCNDQEQFTRIRFERLHFQQSEALVVFF